MRFEFEDTPHRIVAQEEEGEADDPEEETPREDEAEDEFIREDGDNPDE